MDVVTDLREMLRVETGGKARQLARLSSVVRVPRFCVVLADGRTSGDDFPAALHAFTRSDPPGTQYAVRSSANIEDGRTASFAGMFETELGVRAENAGGAILRVMESAHSRRVHEYCREKGFDPESIRMAVIVQKMVPADTSGVSFSRTTTAPGEVMVEAVFGLGEFLVAGRVTPDHYRVDRASGAIVSERVAHQNVMLVLTERGAEERTVDRTDRRSRKLSSGHLAEVVRAVREIEAFLNPDGAVDVEWAISLGELFILQARPLTSFGTDVV